MVYEEMNKVNELIKQARELDNFISSLDDAMKAEKRAIVHFEDKQYNQCVNYPVKELNLECVQFIRTVYYKKLKELDKEIKKEMKFIAENMDDY